MKRRVIKKLRVIPEIKQNSPNGPAHKKTIKPVNKSNVKHRVTSSDYPLVHVEKFKFRPTAFKNIVPVLKHEGETLWVIGTGFGLTLLDKKLTKELNTRTTLAFHNAYPHCKRFGIDPTYWSWQDPSAAMDGLNNLRKNRKKGPKILLHPGLAGNGLTFRKYFGNTLVNYQEYHNHLHEANTNTPIILLPGTSLKALTNNESILMYNNPKERLSKGFVVGSAYEPNINIQKANNGKINAKLENGWHTVENKFSSYILPLAHYLGFKNIVYVGFEGTGPRFFEMNNHKIGAGRNGYDLGMENWKKWSKELGINIYSLIDKTNSKTVKYFKHMTLKEALNKFK